MKALKPALLAAMMFAQVSALQAKVQVTHGCYEKREEPSLKGVAEAIEKIGLAFNEYKKTNDERIELVKKGLPTGDLDVKLSKIDTALNSLEEQKSKLEKLETKLARPGAGASGDREQKESQEAVEYKSAFLNWVRQPGDMEVRGILQQKAKALKAVEKKAVNDDDGWETRAAQTVTSSGSAGGYALPESIESTIARLARDISPIEQFATVRTVGTSDYKELIDVNGATFEWLGETDTRNQTNTPDLAEVAPTFGMGSAKPQASEESLDDLFFNVEDWLVSSAVEAIAQGEGAAYVAGNGTKKPTGILGGPTPVTTADGSRAFGTLQYFASGQAAALPTNLDVLYDMVYGVRARYRGNARWLSAKVTLAGLRKYKDTTGQYLWQPSLVANQPAMFMGYPVAEAEDMPIVAANAFPLAFGDIKEGYLIARRIGMRITRDEITTPGFVKFYVRRRVGGKLRNTEAIKLLKIAAA